MTPFSDLFSVQDRVILITGGAGLLGRTYAEFLYNAGARVVVFDRAKRPDSFPREIQYEEIDITSRASVFEAVQRVVERNNTIDVLINNAAINPAPGSKESELQFAPYEDYPEDLWAKELRVGLNGALFVTQAVVLGMKHAKKGSIVNIASTYGVVGPDNRIYGEGKFKSVGYATVKGAIPNFSRAWATYLRGTGIRVNTLTPGGVLAGQPDDFVNGYEARTILGRMAKPDEYNGAILFLASDASSYMTGANLIVDGGWTAW